MADFLQKILGGGSKPALPAPPPQDAGGFADFVSAPSPVAAASLAGSIPASATGLTQSTIPYTKWYRIWERTSLSDFYMELIILPFVLALVAVHLWGTSTNRRKARSWASTFAPLIGAEFAVVGFGGRKAPTVDSVQSEGLLKSGTSDTLVIPSEVLRENSASEFITYATGRTNVAFLDVKISLLKRFNPLLVLGENILAFFFESMPATAETVESTSYAFDGKEKDLVPVAKGDTVKAGGKSSFDGFVWAVVNKDAMRGLRDERYDLSLTSTKEHAKLPAWTSVMSENSEITESLLTNELVAAVKEAGDDLVALIISDQPVEKPRTLNETIPRKRVTLITKLSSSSDHLVPLFKAFLHLPDHLVQTAHYRPETLRRIKQTRDDEIKKIKKVAEDEEAELRKEKQDKEKKDAREKKLKAMSSEEQKKFLAKERETEQKRMQKRRTMKA